MHVLSINNFQVWCQTWAGFYLWFIYEEEEWHVFELKFNEQVPRFVVLCICMT